MNFNVAFGIVLLASSAYAGPVLDRNFQPRVDLGAPLASLINAILANITEPIPLFQNLDLPDLAEAVGNLINATSPVRGSLYLRNVGITGLDQAQVLKSSLNFTTILNPLSLDFALDGPEFALEGEYTADMLLLGLVPVRGNGGFKCAIQGLTAGYTGSLRLALPLSVKDSDYTFTVTSISVEFEGLLGDPGLADTINRLVSDILTNYILKAVLKLETAVHDQLVELLAGAINQVLSKFTIAELLEFLNNLMKLPPSF